MEIKIVLGIVGGLLIAGSFIPYIRDILIKDTEPHIYTWFIWTVTQAVAAFAILEGNGGLIAALSIAAGAALSLLVLCMSLKHGSRNITRFDTVTLIIAILSLLLWWKLDHPEFAVITITCIDVLGFLPTIRKTWHEPKSEPMIAWVLFTIGNIAALLALTEYNLMTSFYIVSMIGASLVLTGIIFLRDHKGSF